MTSLSSAPPPNHYQIKMANISRIVSMDLQVHLTQLPETTKHYICDICHRQFLEISVFKAHKLKHVDNICQNPLSKSTLMKAEKKSRKKDGEDYSSKPNTIKMINGVLDTVIHTTIKSHPAKSSLSDMLVTPSTLDTRKRSLTSNSLFHIPNKKLKRQSVSTRCHQYKSRYLKERKTHILKPLKSKIRNISRNKKHAVSKYFSSSFFPRKTGFVKLSRRPITRGPVKKFTCMKSGNKSKMNAKTSQGNFGSQEHFGSTVKNVTKIEKYTCEMCSFTCTSLIKLTSHLQKHTSVVHPYKCNICEYSCSRNQKLSRHVAKYHTSEKKSGKLDRERKNKDWETMLYSCTICVFSCNSLGGLRSHVIASHEREKYGDATKSHTSERKSGKLDQEKKNSDGEKLAYSCTICGFFCDSLGGLRSHVVSTHEREKYGDATKYHTSERKSGNLDQENKNNDGKKLAYSCTICGFSCDSLGGLQSHISNHEHEKKYGHVTKYDTLGKKSGKLDEEKKNDGGEKTFYSCTICGFSCDSLGGLRSHVVSTHEREKYEDVTKYDTLARKSGKLDQEKKNDDGKKLAYSCTICKFSSQSLEELRSHESNDEHEKYGDATKSHTSERKSGKLDQKKKNNDGKKRAYSCTICKFSCQSLEELRSHESSHEHEKFGDVAKSQTSGMKSGKLDQKKKNNDGKKLAYSCTICEFSCQSLEELQSHESNHEHEKHGDATKSHTSAIKSGKLDKKKKNNDGKKLAYSCTICEFSCQSLEELRSHESNHEHEKFGDVAKSRTSGRKSGKIDKEKKNNDGKKLAYSCTICEFSCQSLEELRSHESSHEHEKFGDVAKSQTSGRKSGKIDKEKKNSYGKKRAYSCTICEFSCQSLEGLRSHESNHELENNDNLKTIGLFKCVMCFFKCKDVDHLKNHLLNCKRTIPLLCPWLPIGA